MLVKKIASTFFEPILFSISFLSIVVYFAKNDKKKSFYELQKSAPDMGQPRPDFILFFILRPKMMVMTAMISRHGRSKKIEFLDQAQT